MTTDEKLLIILKKNIEIALEEQVQILKSNKTPKLKMELSNIIVDYVKDVNNRVEFILDRMRVNDHHLCDECYRIINPKG